MNVYLSNLNKIAPPIRYDSTIGIICDTRNANRRVSC